VRNDIGSIGKAYTTLRNKQRQMTIGSKEYVEQTKKIRYLKSILDKHNAGLRSTTTLWQKTAGVFKTILPIFSATAIVAGFGQLIRKMNLAAEAADNFEERLDNLSALTGLEGSELEKLGDTAKATSVKITDGGVRIKQSADDIVDAYTKVGSQRPELLKNAEALAAVTEDAIILSEAAKSDLAPAVAGLTTTMNQFNLPASESRRIINAMAAGSKEGAADIPYLTAAVEKSGTTMNLMNVSLEENIGLIESIAPNYAKAELAGNSLDKVFLKLKDKQIGYASGTFNVNDALEELETRYKNGESAASIFGDEHAKMGELLVLNKAEFKRYTTAVTGTNTAIEQAVKNTNNAKAIQEQARNEFHLSAIELGKNLSPAMTTLYKIAGSVASAFTKMIAASPEESLLNEQKQVNALAVELTNINTSEDRRRQILEELETINPRITAGISAENIETEKLKNNLILYNEELANRIVLENLTKEEEGVAANVAKQKAKVASYQYEITQIIAKTDQDIALSNASLEEKTAKTLEVLKQRAEGTMNVFDNEIIDMRNNEAIMLSKLQFLIANTTEAQEELNAATADQGDFSARIQGMKELLGLTVPLTTPPDDTPVGTLKTVGAVVYKWDGKAWNVVQTLVNNPADTATTSKTDPFATEEETPLGIENWMVDDSWDEYGAEELAAKKASEEEWTEFLAEQIDKRVALVGKELQVQEDIEQAREELNEIRLDGISQIASAVSGMFESGSAAQIAAFAFEKALAIASVWINYAKEAAAIRVAAAELNAVSFGVGGTVWGTIQQAKAKTMAIASTALIGAQAVSSAVNMYDGGFAGYTGAGGKYEKKQLVQLHGDEYVVPSELMSLPVVQQIVSGFEQMRTGSGSVNSTLSGMADGGFLSSTSTATTAAQSSISNSEIKQLLAQNTQAMNSIRDMKIYTSIEEIRKMDELYTAIQTTRGL
jgi:TP901 family phage tail tape measure protein